MIVGDSALFVLPAGVMRIFLGMDEGINKKIIICYILLVFFSILSFLTYLLVYLVNVE